MFGGGGGEGPLQLHSHAAVLLPAPEQPWHAIDAPPAHSLRLTVTRGPGPRGRDCSYQDIIEASRLPLPIRPSTFAFGTLADGFLPLEAGSPRGGGSGGGGGGGGSATSSTSTSGEALVVELCSVVMKAVQVRGQVRGRLGRGTALPKTPARAPRCTSRAASSLCLTEPGHTPARALPCRALGW